MSPGAPTEDMEFTGERMVPGRADPATFWHHVYRYRFAAAAARGLRVLDVACGEGYGCHALQQAGAAQVIGVDLSEEAVRHARTRYGVDARVGSAEELPLDAGSLDLVVTFETIEHVPHPACFVDECARVLAPGGRLVLSSPNRELYRLRNGINPFHCSELSEPELLDLLRTRFEIEEVFGQYPELQPAGLFDPRLWRFLPWLQMRGANGVRRRLTRVLGKSFASIPPALAADPSLAVTGIDPDRCPALNPNLIRTRPASPHLDFVFLLVTARRAT